MQPRPLRRPDGGRLSRPSLGAWYRAHGRHALPWRTTRDRWAVLVSEVMLHQTQVPRVAAAYPGFLRRFPDPGTAARAGPAALIAEWGRLGYPRRARRLWETALVVDSDGWPDDLTTLPGVGRYTAAAVAVQADDADVPAVDVNIRRVVQRVAGRHLGIRDAERAMVDVGQPLRGRDRLLALMDLGALVCVARAPDCPVCPLLARCGARGPLPGEARPARPRYAGSFRQRRGAVLARLRDGAAPARELDADALASLVSDGLAAVSGTWARLPDS